MLTRIQAFLQANPAQKAKKVAAHLHVTQKEVNQVLHRNKELFVQDESYQWSLVQKNELRVEFAGIWLRAADFEQAILGASSPLESPCGSVIFVFGQGCKILLEAMARLLALSNQLLAAGKNVSLDFQACKPTLQYLNRIGFFDHLSKGIEVLPSRPVASSAAAYKGNNDGVVELREIAYLKPDQEIPSLLQKSFVNCAGDQYSVAAFTFLTELFNNVQEHSGSTSAAFAGLQFYKKAKHIQTVISDNGIGIVGTLDPILSKRYPRVLSKIKASNLHPGVALLQEVFSVGEISQVDAEGRGLGLKRSVELAQKYRAKISVRQDTFELIMNHDPQGTKFSHTLNLAKLAGTHICFDLKLDQNSYSR
jgi:hypothetical protein